MRLRQNNYAEALDYYQQALALAVESRIAAYRSLCSIGIAYIHALHHEIDASRSALREGADVALQIKSDILMAKALIPAVKLWQVTNNAEQAAVLSGLLTLHPEHAEQKLVDELCKELETEMGVVSYQGAVVRGKQLKLDAAVKELLLLLN